MVTLQEITAKNFEECISLKREAEIFVGDAEVVLAKAYIYREDCLAYAICADDAVVGLVIVLVNPINCPYSFTELFLRMITKIAATENRQ